MLGSVGKVPVIELSILIPTVNDRFHFLKRLLKIIDAQIDRTRIQVCIEADQGERNGGMTIGEKRNRLMMQSVGEYQAFIDDDDRVSEHYFDQILSAIDRGKQRYAQGVDVIGIEWELTKDNQDIPSRAIHSIRYPEIKYRGGVLYRPPSHLNPVKRSLALQVPFPHVSWQEDFDYAKRLFPLLKSEEMTKEPIYFYDYRSKK